MRHHRFLQFAVLCVLGLAPGCRRAPLEGPAGDAALDERARQLAQRFIIADTHIDVPYRMSDREEDISIRTEGGDFDYPRARRGGLDVAFMSIYVPARFQQGGARERADRLIDMVEGFAARWPDKFVLVRSVREVETQFPSQRVALPMGMENGDPLEGSLENLRHFYDRGIRYITLAHSKSNQISDSSYDSVRRWGGLSPFGREVVAEMNRLGIMVDISHLSDEAALQVMALSRAPVIASHSSCRRFTPGWERNMSDALLLGLKENGGVIQINFGSSFIDDSYRRAAEARERAIESSLHSRDLEAADPRAQELIRQYDLDHPIAYPGVARVADHIDHVARLIGIDHVGLGSDFDGVGDSLPTGLKDVSEYPNLIRELLARGYSEEDIEKICSRNLLRVWSQVEQLALRLQGRP